MEVPSKVISSNVLANRNVNVPVKNSLVTKSPLTFSNKLERPQISKINNFFPVSSKGKSDSISPAGYCSPAGQTPSAVSAFKVTTAPTKSDNQYTSGNGGNSTSLDASLGFPLDDWDDLDDFETPVKAKNDSFTSGVSGKLNHEASLTTPESSSSIANKNCLSKSEQCCMETDELEQSDYTAAVSPGPSLNQDPAESEPEVSPIKRTRWRPPPPVQSVLSSSEEDNDDVLEPLKGKTGNKVFVAAFVFYLYIMGQICF